VLNVSEFIEEKLNDVVQQVSGSLTITWADSRVMDNLQTSATSQFDTKYFVSSEAGNGRKQQGFRWAVTDTLDQNGEFITANGSYVCMDPGARYPT
jgi:hypothetical protein